MLERIDFSSKRMAKEEYKPVHDELVDRLVLLQQQARSAGVGMVVLVEGWAGAGKGPEVPKADEGKGDDNPIGTVLGILGGMLGGK